MLDVFLHIFLGALTPHVSSFYYIYGKTDHHAPVVKRAAAAVESALQNRERTSKKSYTLYQLARYVKRH